MSIVINNKIDMNRFEELEIDLMDLDSILKDTKGKECVMGFYTAERKFKIYLLKEVKKTLDLKRKSLQEELKVIQIKLDRLREQIQT